MLKSFYTIWNLSICIKIGGVFLSHFESKKKEKDQSYYNS